MKKLKVGSTKDLDKFNQFSKWVENHDILVFKYNNSIRAFSNICPHFGGPVGYHEIKKNKKGLDVFTCLWHNLQFDVKSGACTTAKNLKLREYKVEIDNDDIFVHVN